MFKSNAELKIYVYKEEKETLIGAVPLIGSIGICKLDVNTRFPLRLQSRASKTVNIVNSGNMEVEASAVVVNSKENHTECRDFFVCPNNIYLKPGQSVDLQISYKPENHRTDIERWILIKDQSLSK